MPLYVNDIFLKKYFKIRDGKENNRIAMIDTKSHMIVEKRIWEAIEPFVLK